MEIKEKAEEYAKNKILNTLNDIVAEAYMEGYKQGYKDHEAQMPVEFQVDDIEYVNLGLPSGTLWAKNYVTVDGDILYLPYDKVKEYKIPTLEQFEELKKYCKRRTKRLGENLEYKIFLGTNGSQCKITNVGYCKGNQIINRNFCEFWLYDDEPEGNYRLTAYLTKDHASTNSSFMGLQLPMLLVK